MQVSGGWGIENHRLKFLTQDFQGENIMQYRILVIIALLFLWLQPVFAKDASGFFSESFGNYQEELELAQEENKKGVLIFFEMDDCPFCHWMKKNVLNRAEVQKYFKEHFLIFSMDIEGDVEITDFEGNATTQKDFSFKKNRVRATPVFGFFNLEGKRVTRFTGRTANAKEFMLLGEYVVNKAYQNMSFSKYKRKNR